ncbi:MAG: exo-alpha-sialidase [Thermoguttaceae bacterium]|nr:exo-alpha-sialidase [Thermoguttaceae bacterium]
MKKMFSLLCVLALFVASSALAMDPSISLHQNAEPFPSPFPGPFIRAADNSIVTISGTEAHWSVDEGKTWESAQALDPEKYSVLDFSIVRAKDDSLVIAFDNGKELKSGKWNEGSVTDWEIPVYIIRSVDNGRTWSEPLPLQRDWVGALRAMVTLKSGRIVLATMALQPWNHIIPVYYSDDAGQSWTKTQTIVMEGAKTNDHDGAMEPKLVEKKDGSVYMLIRTTRGTFYRSISTDGGETWSKPESTGIENNNSYGELAVLSDGRWVLVWNRDEKFPAFNYEPDPNDWIVEDMSYSWIKRRNKLSIAFSSDEGETWTEPVVLASTDNEKIWIAYSIFFEQEPGVFWIATQQGDVRLKIQEKNL